MPDETSGALREDLPERLSTSLSDNYLLEGMSAETIANMESLCKRAWCPEGEKVFDRADTESEVFFVTHGSVRVVDHAASGQEVAFSDLEAGEIFGELSAIDGAPRSATVYALEDSAFGIIRAELFREYLSDHPHVALRLMDYLVGTIRGLNSRVVGLSSMSSIQRVYGELLQMSEPDTEQAGRWMIRSMPNHKEIAVWAGTTPETVARAIGQLLKAEVVKRRNKTLYILDRGKLHDLAVAT